jgi:hypothetical protein
MQKDERNAQEVKKQPTVWILSADIPNFFSFNINKPNTAKLITIWGFFNQLIKILNSLARGERVRLSDDDVGDILTTLINGQTILRSINTMEAKKMLARLHLAEYLLMPFVFEAHEVEEKLDEAITYLRTLLDISEEMNWYFISALRCRACLTNNYTNEIIKESVRCLRTMTSNNYRNATLSFIIEYAKKTAEYIDYTPFIELARLFPEKPYPYGGLCASMRHEYILISCVQNPEYFALQDSSLYEQDLNKSKDLELVFLKVNLDLGHE